ncbi:MAG: ABC transporter ATP-binding protein, partial [Phycisphaerales bacterium JB041]
MIDQMDTGGSRGKPVVACQNLTKVFRDFWMRNRAKAVDSLTFEIYPHEIFGLLGPNGSGKSTTIKIILGLLRPTKGRVAVFNKPPSDVITKKRIGYLPEESYLYPFLNAKETLDYYGKLFEIGHTTRRRRIDELLDMVGLTHVQHRPIREYSKGMQRRIGLAQALINDPDLLILDEPTTGLDPIGTRQVKDLIIEMGRRGKTVLLSSHLLADVEDCV